MLCYFSHVEDPHDIVMDSVNSIVQHVSDDHIIGMAVSSLNTLLMKLGTLWNDEGLPVEEFYSALAKVIFHTSTLAYKFTNIDDLNMVTEAYAGDMLASLKFSPTEPRE